ncbi:MAG: DUF1800 domain-containing protein [Chloroflexota bacterium]|nr:DUF1800 domain-containing protein [Dehalococcoidia bacterium]MDW8254585.1 DUF1800 domain-containing protein [Chloroflexota bacterium]
MPVVADPTVRSVILERSAETSRIAHLLRRAAFGASPTELARSVALGFERTVDALLDFDAVPDMPDPAAVIPNFDPERIASMQQRWVYRLVGSPKPLQEKMTLFWHSHFATANSKVNNAGWMWNQNELFRRHALGNFRTLVHEVAKDPAMMRWLDTVTSKKGRPNENFARELFELFTMGIGNYTEEDIKEAARAFTGWEVRNDAFFFNRAQHDSGQKTIFGRTGAFTGEQVIDLAVSHPATARFIATKLYVYFVDDHPSKQTIDRLATIFTQNGYELKPLVRAILLSPEFSSPAAYHAKIKSPVDFVIGSVKALGIPAFPQLAATLTSLGQALFNPPTVKGWPEGVEWISASSLLARQNFANQLTSGRNAARRPWITPAEDLAALGLRKDEEVVDFYLNLLVDGDVTPAMRNALLAYLASGSRAPGRRGWDGKVRGLIHLIMSSPVYQFN